MIELPIAKTLAFLKADFLDALCRVKKWSSISLTLLFNFSRKNDHLHTGNRSKTGSDPCSKSSKNGVWQQVLLLLLRSDEARRPGPHYLKETTPPTWSKDSTTIGFRLGFRLGICLGFRSGFRFGFGFVYAGFV